MTLTLGRTETARLQNKSGGALVQGDVVIVDGGNAFGVTVTSTLKYITTRIGVVLETSIASDAFGIVAFSGYVPKINLNGSAALGNFVTTSTTNKQGHPHSGVAPQGAFAQVLETGTSPAALLLGSQVMPAVPNGYQPFAYPLNFVSDMAFTTALALAANGGSIAIPIPLVTSMLLESVSIRNTDTATERTWGWDLYLQSALSETLDRVAACTANETDTPSAASVRTLAAGSAPVSLGAGLYWLVIQNRHASNTYGLGTTAVSSAFAVDGGQTKTTTNPNGATLDFIAATWAKQTAAVAARLNGRVFGESTAF